MAGTELRIFIGTERLADDTGGLIIFDTGAEAELGAVAGPSGGGQSSESGSQVGGGQPGQEGHLSQSTSGTNIVMVTGGSGINTVRGGSLIVMNEVICCVNVTFCVDIIVVD